MRTSSAVAIPKDISKLFSNLSVVNDFEEYESTLNLPQPTTQLKSLSPFLQTGSVSLEIEVLNLIAKVCKFISCFYCKLIAFLFDFSCLV